MVAPNTLLIQGVRKQILVLIFFYFFEKNVFGFVLAVCALVHNVEAISHIL